MSGLSYTDLIRELFPKLTGQIRWGLARTERLLAATGDPHRRFWSLHVGGTNGKGSVAATLASVLRAGGRRVGLYTSPHLCSFRERIQIDGEPIAEEALLDAANRLWPMIQREGPSFFEATTALAFLALAEAGVEAAIIEVGLGGRLDATNVVRPDVAIITNVALDHAQYLGHTLAAVAGEKAGIIKPAVPLITAEGDEGLRRIFGERAAAAGAAFHALEPADVAVLDCTLGGTTFRVRTEAWGELTARTPLVGGYQAVNAALAVRALELLAPHRQPARAAIEKGIAAVRWPGRLQVERVRGRTWLFDVAHNPAGVQALVGTLAALDLPRPLAVMVGILGDKDWTNMLPPLFGLADAAVLTIPESAPAERAWRPAEVLTRVGAPSAEIVEDFEAALERAGVLAGGRGTVLVTGSFHTVGDALARLGRAPWGVDPPLPSRAGAA